MCLPADDAHVLPACLNVLPVPNSWPAVATGPLGPDTCPALLPLALDGHNRFDAHCLCVHPLQPDLSQTPHSELLSSAQALFLVVVFVLYNHYLVAPQAFLLPWARRISESTPRPGCARLATATRMRSRALPAQVGAAWWLLHPSPGCASVLLLSHRNVRAHNKATGASFPLQPPIVKSTVLMMPAVLSTFLSTGPTRRTHTLIRFVSGSHPPHIPNGRVSATCSLSF